MQELLLGQRLAEDPSPCEGVHPVAADVSMHEPPPLSDSAMLGRGGPLPIPWLEHDARLNRVTLDVSHRISCVVMVHVRRIETALPVAPVCSPACIEKHRVSAVSTADAHAEAREARGNRHNMNVVAHEAEAGDRGRRHPTESMEQR